MNFLERPTEPLGPRVPTISQLNEILPNYEVTDLIGRGGMGAVFKAVQPNLDRHVAIKILPIGLAEGQDDLQFVERFKQEAKAMAKLNHPSIVHVHDFGEATTPKGTLLYFIMEFIQGSDIREHLKEKGGQLKPEPAHSIISDVLDALGFAHESGIIHRDIKPANIMLNLHGRVKVADFGVAKALGAGGDVHTQTNMMLGTPDYVAPEARDLGSAVDGRADLFAAGAMLYEMLSGKLPRGAFKPASEISSDIDPRYDDIIVKALQPDPGDRYQTAKEFQEDLDQILREPILAPSQMIKSGQERQKTGWESPSKFAAKTSGSAEILFRIAILSVFAGLAWPLFAGNSGLQPKIQGGWLCISGFAAMFWKKHWISYGLVASSLIPIIWLTVANWSASEPNSANSATLALVFLTPVIFAMIVVSRLKLAGRLLLRLGLMVGFGMFALICLSGGSDLKLPLIGNIEIERSLLKPAKSGLSAILPSLGESNYGWIFKTAGIAALVACVGLWSQFTLGFSSILLSILGFAGITTVAAGSTLEAIQEWGPDLILHLPLVLLPIVLWRLVLRDT